MSDLIAAGEAFRNALAWVCLRGAVVLFAALALWLLGKVAGAQISKFWRNLTAVGRAVVCAMLLVGVIYGGGKTNEPPRSAGVTQGGAASCRANQAELEAPPPCGAAHLVSMQKGGAADVTPEEIAQGCRIVSMATNSAPFAAMPSNAVEYARWS